jgi:hypothetical protein
MDYDDYAELRRRAEKRLTVVPVWPLLLFQAIAYFMMMARHPQDFGTPTIAFLSAAGITGISWFVHRRRSAANKSVRRAAIDDTLQEMLDTGWPIEDPTARDLRLLAIILDEDIEARAGWSFMAVQSGAAAVIGWVVTFIVASSLSIGPNYGPTFLIYVFLFLIWLLSVMGFRWLQLRQRRQSETRARTILARTSGRLTGKPKRSVEAPWWDEDADPDKPRRVLLEEDEMLRVEDDGELPDEFTLASRLRSQRGGETP